LIDNKILFKSVANVLSCFLRNLFIVLFIFSFGSVSFSADGDGNKVIAKKKTIRTKKTNLTKNERAKKNVVRKTVQKAKSDEKIRSKTDSEVADVKIVKKTIYVNSPLCEYAEKNDITSLRKSLLKVNYDVSKVNTICLNGESLLLRAVKNNNYLVAKLLIDSGADVNMQNVAGVSPLHIVARVDTKEMDKILYLLLHEKDIDINLKDAEGYTPLMRAVEFEKISVIEKLLKKKADKTIKNNYGYSAIDLANNVLSGKKTEEEIAISTHIVKLLNEDD